MIKGVQIDICPELTGEIPDAQDSWAIDGKKIITGKINHIIYVIENALTAS